MEGHPGDEGAGVEAAFARLGLKIVPVVIEEPDAMWTLLFSIVDLREGLTVVHGLASLDKIMELLTALRAYYSAKL